MINSTNYIKLATNTEAPITSEMKERIQSDSNIRLLHAGIGMATESGEFLDAIKKHIYYGRPLDKVNLAEETQDLCWYIAIALDELGLSFDEALTTNIKKLQARYPNNFTEFHAENRDLETERKILDGDCGKCEASDICKGEM